MSHAKKGFSLLVVLGMTLLATLVGISVYKLLSQANQTSGAQLHQNSAAAAAKAGLASTRSWFIFHAEDALSVLQQFDQARKDALAAAPAQPMPAILLNVRSDFQDNALSQNFQAYLVDYYRNPTTSDITIKVRVDARGQDGSIASMTGIYRVRGVQPSTITTTSEGVAFMEDAIHLSAGMGHLNSGTQINGSLFVKGGTFKVNSGTPVVKGDIIVVDADIDYDAPVEATGNLVFIPNYTTPTGTKQIKTNGNHTQVAGHAYIDGLYTNDAGTLTVGGDLTLVKALPRSGVWNIGGNAKFMDDIGMDAVNGVSITVTGDVRVDKNIGTNQNGGGGYTFKGSTEIAGALTVRHGNANILMGDASGDDATNVSDKDTIRLNTVSGDAGKIASAIIYGSATVQEKPQASWTTSMDPIINPANDLLDLRNTIAERQKAPISGINVKSGYTNTWNTSTGLGVSGCSQTGIIAQLNCVYDKWKDDDSKLQNKFMVVDFASLSNDIYLNDVALQGKFIFLNISGTSVTLPKVVGDSKLLIQSKMADVKKITINDICQCIIYNTGTGKPDLNMGTNGLLKGAYVGLGSIQPQSGGFKVEYDATTIKAISTSGAIVGRDGITIDPGSVSITTTSLELLSPRLQLDLLSEYYGVEELTSNIQPVKRSIAFSPQAIRIVQGSGYSEVEKVMEDYNVKTYYSLGATPGECAPVLGGSNTFPDELGVYPFRFKTGCEDTYTNFYVIVDANITGDPASIIAGFEEMGTINIDEEQVNSGSLTEKELSIKLRNKNNVVLTEDITISFDFVYAPTGKSEHLAVGENFTLQTPTSKSFTIPAGTTVTDGQLFKIKLDLLNDIQRNELFQAVDVVLSVSGSKLILDPSRSKVTLNFQENLWDTFKLIWSDYSSVGGKVDVQVLNGKCESTGVPDQFQCQKFTNLVLTALPEPGYEFEWTDPAICNNASGGTLTDANCAITLENDGVFGLAFPMQKMKLSLKTTGSGNISVNGVLITDLSTPIEFNYGTEITIKALPGVDALWGGWAVVGASLTDPLQASQTFTMESDATLTAQFKDKVFECFYDQGSFPSLKYDNTASWGLSTSAKATGTSPLLRIQTNPPTLGTLSTTMTADRDHPALAGLVMHYVSPTSFLFLGVQPGNSHDNHIVFCQDQNPAVSKVGCQTAAAGFDIPAKFELSVTEEPGGKYLVRIDGKAVARFALSSPRLEGQIGIVDFDYQHYTSFQALSWNDALIGCGATVGNAPELTSCKINGTLAGATSHTSPLVIGPSGSAPLEATLSDADGEATLYYTLRGTDGTQIIGDPMVAGNLSRSLTFYKEGDFTLSLSGKDAKGNASNTCVWFYRVGTTGSITAMPSITTFTVKKGGTPFESGALDAGGTTLQFAVDASTSDISDQLTLTWSGDISGKSSLTSGNTGSVTHQHTYTSPGTYSVTVTATSKYGPSVTETRVFRIDGTSKAPVIQTCKGEPYPGYDRKIAFEVDANDPASLPLTYSWSGAVTSTEKNFHYYFDQEGTYTTYVVATNSAGVSSQPCRVTAIAMDQTTPTLDAPTCKLVGPSPLKMEGDLPVFTTGTSITLEASSAQPGSFQWTDAFADAGNSNKVSRTFTGPGTYSASARLQNSDGLLSDACTSVGFKIEGKAPTIATLTCSGDKGSYAPATLSCNASAAKGSSPISAYDWKLKDEGGNVIASSSGMTSTFNKAVTVAQTYTAELTVTDVLGMTASKTVAVTLVANAGPTTGSCSVPASGNAGVAITATIGSGWSDADGIAKYIVIWSDATANSEGAGTSYNHTYATAASYTVKVKAVDTYGAVSAEKSCGIVNVAAIPLTPFTFVGNTQYTMTPGFYSPSFTGTGAQLVCTVSTTIPTNELVIVINGSTNLVLPGYNNQIATSKNTITSFEVKALPSGRTLKCRQDW